MKVSIVEEIGRSAICTYYKAKDEVGNHLYLKVLNEGLENEGDIQKRFEREAKILRRLSHPNIVRLVWSGRVGRRSAMGFEYIKGDTLQTLLRKKGKIPLNEVYRIAKPLLSALDYIHAKGILHRDVKPSNILLDEDGTPKLSDFGLAMGKDIPTVTLDGTLLGTPNYMSPEQVEGKELDGRSDLYSLGIVMLELLTGKKAFRGENYGEVLKRLLTSSPEGVEAAPEEIKILIEKDREKRTATAAEMLEMLGGEISHKRVIKRGLIPLEIAACLAVVIVLLIIYYNRYQRGFPNASSNQKESFIVSPLDSSYMQAPSVEENDEVTVGEEPLKRETQPALAMRKIWLNVLPYAEIYYRGYKIGETPPPITYQFEEATPLLTFKSPVFPEVNRILDRDSTLIDLSREVSYLRLSVLPWAEVWIDGELNGVTPFDKPIIILPGKHKITLHNPYFKDEKKEVTAGKGDTLSIVMQLSKE